MSVASCQEPVAVVAHPASKLGRQGAPLAHVVSKAGDFGGAAAVAKIGDRDEEPHRAVLRYNFQRSKQGEFTCGASYGLPC